MKQSHKLRAYWSRRERDLTLAHPHGGTARADACWLYSILNKQFIDELVRRGYDPETIRFSVNFVKDGDAASGG